LDGARRRAARTQSSLRGGGGHPRSGMPRADAAVLSKSPAIDGRGAGRTAQQERPGAGAFEVLGDRRDRFRSPDMNFSRHARRDVALTAAALASGFSRTVAGCPGRVSGYNLGSDSRRDSLKRRGTEVVVTGAPRKRVVG